MSRVRKKDLREQCYGIKPLAATGKCREFVTVPHSLKSLVRQITVQPDEQPTRQRLYKIKWIEQQRVEAAEADGVTLTRQCSWPVMRRHLIPDKPERIETRGGTAAGKLADLREEFYTDVTQVIRSAVTRVHAIVVDVYQFIRLYLLTELEAGRPLPSLDRDLVDAVIRVVGRLNREKTSEVRKQTEAEKAPARAAAKAVKAAEKAAEKAAAGPSRRTSTRS